MEPSDLIACVKCGIYEPQKEIVSGVCLVCRRSPPTAYEVRYGQQYRKSRGWEIGYYWTAAVLCLFISGFVISLNYLGLGIFIMLTVTPILVLYPLVRGVLFSGNDGIWTWIVTVIIEEYFKSAVTKALTKKSKKKRHY